LKLTNNKQNDICVKGKIKTHSYNLESFASHKCDAFNGLALVIVRSMAGKKGTISVTAKSNGLKETQVVFQSK